MLKIGVTPSFMYPDSARKFFWPKRLSYIEQEMINYLSCHNAIPVMILDYPDQQLNFLLNELDGIIFSGGSDVDPKSYNEDHIDSELWPGDPVRDSFEKKIYDKVVETSIPILAICRGAQFINVAMGGTLYQDLKTQVSQSITHRNHEQYDKLHHEIKFSKGSLIQQFYKDSSKHYVNSIHHQGIKDLAPNLIVEATCPVDNIIEAYRYKDIDKKFILGVQWHPEFKPKKEDKLIDPDPIYQYFINAVKINKR